MMRVSGLRGALLFAIAAISCGGSVRAWGPHPKITTAAIATLGRNAAIERYLGRELDRLAVYCWMADWQRSLILNGPGGSFYADDFLLFPRVNQHFEHETPDVEGTYGPYMRRAIQAIRNETPTNAARWIGSLLHFVEDSGSPPHAFRTNGVLHTRMENWVDEHRIKLDDYRPRSLGLTEDAAVNGLIARMNGLIAYSRERGRMVRPMAETNRRKDAEAIILESALETSRVVADLLLTLGQFVGGKSTGASTIKGVVKSSEINSMKMPPAKIIVEGTDYSTLADQSGAYEFRNMPAGEYRMLVVRAGNDVLERRVTLPSAAVSVVDMAMMASDPPGNLVRDSRFRLHWARPETGDGWYRISHKGAKAWQGEPVPVEGGRRYRLSVRWKTGVKGAVTVLWDESPATDQGEGAMLHHYYTRKVDANEALAAGESEKVLVSPRRARTAVVLFKGADAPGTLCESVSFGLDQANANMSP